MGIDIQRNILGLKGQRVNEIKLNEKEQQLVICCRRDRRRNAIVSVITQFDGAPIKLFDGFLRSFYQHAVG